MNIIQLLKEMDRPLIQECNKICPDLREPPQEDPNLPEPERTSLSAWLRMLLDKSAADPGQHEVVLAETIFRVGLLKLEHISVCVSG